MQGLAEFSNFSLPTPVRGIARYARARGWRADGLAYRDVSDEIA